MDLITLPMVTEALTLNTATHLAKTSPLLYFGISEGMITDVDIVLKYAREVYQRWLNERVYEAGDVIVFDKSA